MKNPDVCYNDWRRFFSTNQDVLDGSRDVPGNFLDFRRQGRALYPNHVSKGMRCRVGRQRPQTGAAPMPV